jgi:hypothetical protein
VRWSYETLVQMRYPFQPLLIMEILEADKVIKDKAGKILELCTKQAQLIVAVALMVHRHQEVHIAMSR